MAEVDGAFDALRQKILEMPPTDFCGHVSRDFNGNCMACAREAERREDMARAWDEGYTRGYENGALQARAGSGANPYRPPTATPDPAGTSEQEASS